MPTSAGQEQPTLTASYEDCPPTADCFAEAPWVHVRLELAGRPYATFTLLLDRRGRISDFGVDSAPPSAD